MKRLLMIFLLLPVLAAGCSVASEDQNITEMYISETEDGHYDEVLENDFVPDYDNAGEINKMGISNSNINAGGFMTMQGQYIYYIYNNSIYKCKEGSEPALLASYDNPVYCINVCGDYIYFSTYSVDSDAYSIIQLRTDGDEQCILVQGLSNSTFLLVNDSKPMIYYTGLTNNQSSEIVKCLAEYDIDTGTANIRYKFLDDSSKYSYYYDRENHDARICGFQNNKLLIHEFYSRVFSVVGWYDLALDQFDAIDWGEEYGIQVRGEVFPLENGDLLFEFPVTAVVDRIIHYNEQNGIIFDAKTDLSQKFNIQTVYNDQMIYWTNNEIWMLPVTELEKSLYPETGFVVAPADDTIQIWNVADAQLIIQDQNATSFAVAGDWLYYKTGDYDDEDIYRVKMDGSNWEYFMSENKTSDILLQ